MNYNDKLKQLIKDAADHGYKYKNGEFSEPLGTEVPSILKVSN